MAWSHSKRDCWRKCPYQYKLKYLDRLKTIPETNADNALWLGLGLHKGIETTVEEGLAEYASHYNVITDENVNWMMQLEYQLPRVKEMLPEGEHEVQIETDEFIGFIDLVAGDTLYDFKFSNAVDRYRDSPQLSIYKYYYELTHPGRKIEHLKYVFVPKVGIRQKKTESLYEFRNRLQGELERTEIQFIEVPYLDASVTQFRDECNTISTQTEFPKNPTRLCGWCDFKSYCESNGEIDYMIIKREELK